MKILLPLALLLGTPALAADAIAGTRLDISVVGSVTQAPDIATISAGVTTQAPRAAAAMADTARAMADTVAALRQAGVADRDIQTASIDLAPQYRYADNQPPTLTGYQASNRVSVRLREIGRVGAVLDALVAAGANQINGPAFSIGRPDAALDQARTQAIATARARAELYARAAGLHVVRIVSIHEEESGPPAVRPMAMMAVGRSATTPIEAGEQDVDVRLSVTFELG